MLTRVLTKVLREYGQLVVGLGLIGVLLLGFLLAQPGHREPRSSSDHVAPTPSTVTLTPEPEPESAEALVGVLHGQVSDESGRPVAGVRVSAAGAPYVTVEMRHGYAPAGQVHTVNTDAEGRYRFDELPVGTYRVGTGGGATVVWYPSGAHVLAGEDVVVKEKATTRLDLERAAPASVAGTVRVPRGQTYTVLLEQRVTPTPERTDGWLEVTALEQRRDYEFAALRAHRTGHHVSGHPCCRTHVPADDGVAGGRRTLPVRAHGVAECHDRRLRSLPGRAPDGGVDGRPGALRSAAPPAGARRCGPSAGTGLHHRRGGHGLRPGHTPRRAGVRPGAGLRLGTG